MRVFAGPNGSGKSSVIDYVKKQKVKGHPIDFGIYVNADDIAHNLRNGTFSFHKYEIKTTPTEFAEMALASGLINDEFRVEQFKSVYTLSSNSIKLKPQAAQNASLLNPDEYLAQIIADFLRKRLLEEEKKFSFETVFSHKSKLDIMKQAAQAGYKVYFYFVSTESPEINKFRVRARKEKGGHDVPAHKIESRYLRSMELLYDASQLAYQAFYFDNSENAKEFRVFAHFKKTGDKKKWDKIEKDIVPAWFIKYYLNKQSYK
jgi:predicted ABC-type ATPase